MPVDVVGFLRKYLGPVPGAVVGFWGWLQGQYAELCDWLGPDVATTLGKLNWNELIKIAMLTLTNGGLSAFAQALVSTSHVVFIDPQTAAWVSSTIMFLTAICDAWRRLQHGASSPPPPTTPLPPQGQ